MSVTDPVNPRFSFAPMRFTLMARTKRVRTAMVHLMWLLENENIGKSGQQWLDRDKLRAALETVVLDLYVAAVARPGAFRSLSRERRHFGPGGRYPQVTALSVLIVSRFLVRSGLAAMPKDLDQAHAGTGPFLRATRLLVDMLEGVFGVSPEGLAEAVEESGQLVRLRTGTGKTRRAIAYRPTAATWAMHKRIAAANSLRAGCRFSFSGRQPPHVDLGKGDLHRLFTDGRWDRGGRFFGGWWLMLRKEDRQRIRIDGEDTVELDYRSCQPRICFHLDGEPLPPDVDPYALPDFPPKTYREAIKATVAQLLLFGPHDARRPKEHKSLFETNRDYGAFVTAVAAALAPISDWFGAERSAELEFVESEIADAVIVDLTGQGIPCLPVHDGFIVARSAEGVLGRAMCRAYCDRLYDLTGVAAYPPIWGWSTPEMERGVSDALPPLAGDHASNRPAAVSTGSEPASGTVPDDEKTLRRLELEHSRPVRWHRASSDAAAVAAVDELVTALIASETRTRARRPDDLARLRATVEALALDLFVCAKADPVRYLAYPRDNNAFKASRYANPAITATNARAVADFLLDAGFAEGARGYHRRSDAPFGGTLVIGRRSRVRATPKLIDLFKRHGLTPRAVGFTSDAEVIRLKGPAGRRQAKPLLEYGDDETTRAMRERLGRINALLAETRIDLEGDSSEDPQEIEDDAIVVADTDDRPDAQDRSAVRLHRVFNNGSFAEGGRFYGGWWMALSKQDRSRLVIEGEPTIELDFRALHARLCYQMEGHPLPVDVDPYALPALPGASREIVKAAVNRLLNGSPGKIPKVPEGFDRMSWRNVIASVERHHRPIAAWFRSGRGLQLQHIDSAIASAVLDALAHLSIPCLPVHDSFIVAESHERALGEAMYLAYWGQAERFGAAKASPVIAGWSSAQVEERVSMTVGRTG